MKRLCMGGSVHHHYYHHRVRRKSHFGLSLQVNSKNWTVPSLVIFLIKFRADFYIVTSLRSIPPDKWNDDTADVESWFPSTMTRQ